MPHFTRKGVRALLSCLVLLFAQFAYAQVAITQATASSSACIGGSPVSLSNIIISETALGDFGNTTSGPGTVSFTIGLTSPDFSFVPAIGSISLFPGSGDITLPTFNVTATSIQIGFNFSNAPPSFQDAIVISGIQVTASGPGASADLNLSALSGTNAGTPEINGFTVSTTVFGSITSSNAPTVNAGPDATSCFGQTNALAGATSSNGTIAWTENGTGTLDFPATINPTYTPGPGETGNITFTLTITGTGNCGSVQDTKVLNILTSIVADAGSPQTICNGASATIGGSPTASGGAGSYTYTWLPSASVLANPVVSPIITTPYNLVVTDGFGCVNNTQSVTITVNSIPATPSITSPAGPIDQCEGVGTITLNSSLAPVGGTYQWYKNGSKIIGQVASSLALSEVPGTTGNYTVTVLDVAPTFCESAQSAALSITIHAKPLATPTVSPATMQICDGGAASVTVNGSELGVIYQAFNGITPISGFVAGTGGPIILTTGVLTTGLVTVTVKAANPAGCTITLGTSSAVTVNQLPVANAGGPASVCSGLTTVLNGSATLGTAPYSYSWSPAVGLSLTTSQTPTFSGLTTTTFSLVVTDNKGCISPADNATVTVNPLPTPTLIVSANPVCSGTSVTFTAGPGAGPAVSNYDFRVNGSSVQSGAGTTYNTSALLNGDVVAVIATSSVTLCTATSAGITMTIHALPTPTLGATASAICAGTSVTFTAGPGAGPPISNYNFRVNGLSVQNSPSNMFTSSTLVNGDVVGVITTTGTTPSCSAASSTITMTVNPVPTPTLIVSANPVCSGTSVTFTAGAGAGPAITNFDFRVNGLSVQNGPGNTYVTSASVNGDVVTVVATSGAGPSCNVTSAGITMTIHALPTPTISSTASSICAGTSVTFTAGPGAGPAITNYNFRVNSISVQSSLSNIYTSSALVNGDVVDVIATTGSVPACPVTSSTITMTVNPVPTPTLIVSANPVCSGTSVTFTAGAGAGPAITNFDFRVNGISVQSGPGNTYVTSASVNGDVVTVVATSGAAPSCNVTSAGITMTIHALPTPTIGSTASSICAGTSVTFTAGPGAGPAITNYNFRVNSISVQSSLSNIYTSSALVNGDVVDVIATTGSVPACPVTSSTITMTVNPVPTPTLIVSANPVCSGTSVTFTAGAGAGPAITNFDFRVNGISVQSGPGNTYVTSASVNGDVVTVVATSGAAPSCNVTSAGITMTIHALPTPTIGSTASSICAGTSVTFTAGPGAGPAITNYNFRVNSISVQSSLSNIYTSSALVNGDVVDVIATTGSVPACPVTSSTITMTVNPVPTPTLIVSANPVCSGTSVTFTAGAGAGPAISNFDFRVNGLSVQSGPGNTYVTSASVNGDVVTVVATSGAGPSCNVTSAGITMTIHALPTPTISSTASSICAGTSVTFTAGPGAGPAITNYNFRVNSISVQTGLSNIYTSSALVNGDVVDVIATTGSVPACPVTSSTITMTVNPVPTPTLIVSANPVCSGTSVTFTAGAGAGPAITNFDFRVNGLSVQNGPGNTYVTSASVNGDVVTVVATSGAGPSCNVTSAGITMTIHALPTPTISSTASSICAGTSVTFTAGPGAGPAITNYNFRVNSISVQSSLSNIYTSSALVNGDVVDVIATTGSVPACPVTSSTITMTVNPVPTPTLIVSANPVCAGTSVTFTAGAGAGPAISNFDFRVNGLSVQNGPGNTYVTSASVNGDVVTVVATSGAGPSCNVTSAGITMTIHALPTPTIGSTASSICAGTSVTFTAGPGAGPAITNYNFRVNSISVQSSLSNIYTSSALVNGDVVDVIATTGSVPACPVTSSTITMTVNPVPTPTLIVSANPVCSGTSVTFTAGAGAGPAITNFDFRVNGISVQSGPGNTYVTSASVNGDVVTVVATSGAAPSCNVTSAGITMTIHALPTPTIGSTASSICAGTSVTFTAGPGAGPAITNYNFRVNSISVQSSLSNIYTSSALVNGDVVDVIATTGSVPACPVTSSTITMTVNPVPTPTLIVSANPVCSGTSVTFTAGAGAGPAITNFDFRVNGISVQSGPGNTYVTSASVNGDVVTVVATSGAAPSCNVTSAGITMTIHALPTPTIGSTASSICAGTSVTFTAGPGAGPAITNYNFRVNSISVQSSLSNIYTSSALVNGDVVDVIATTGSVPACPVTSSTITMTVNPVPTPTLIVSANPVCSGTSVTFTAGAGAGPAITNFDFRVNGISVQSGPGNTYVTSASVNGDVVTVVATSGAGPSCNVTSAGITMTIHALPTPTISSTASSICAGTSVTFTAGPGAGPAITNYNFRVNSISVQSSLSNIYTSSALVNGDVVDVIATTGSVPACPVTSSTITMTVNPVPTPTLIVSANPVCSGTSVTFTAGAGAGPAITNFDFRVNGISVQSGPGNTYVTSASVNGDVVTVVATSGAGPSCNVTSAGITMTIHALPTPTISSTASSICAGTSVTFTAGPGAGPAITNYNFRVNSISVQTGLSNIYTSSALVNGDVVDVIATTGSVPACPVTSSTITMTVNPVPTPTLIVSANPVCSGTSVTFTAGAGAGPAITNFDFRVNGLSVQNGPGNTYVTSASVNGDVVTVVATSGAGPSCNVTSAGITMTIHALPTPTISSTASSICAGTSVTFTAGPGAGPAITNYNFRVNSISVQTGLSNIYTSSALVNGDVVDVIATTGSVPACPVTSSTITMTVNPVPTPTLIVSANPVCAGTSVTFTAGAGAGPAISNFDFRVNGLSVQNGPGNTYVTSASVNGDVVTVVATSGAGPSCNVTSAGITMTIHALPTPTISSTASSICAGTSVTFTAGPGAGPAITNYNFRVNSISVQSSLSNIYTSSALVNGDVVDVIATTGSVPACPVTSSTITMTVNPVPTPTLIVSANPVCSGTSVTFTAGAGAGPAITNFDFRVNGLSVQNGPGNTYVTSASVNGDVVTVVATSGAGPSCTVTSAAITMTVNPVPVVAASQIKTVCAGQNINFKVALTPAGFPIGTTFSWPAPTMSAGGAQGTSGSAVPESNPLTITESLVNATGGPITATYKITPTSSFGCAGTQVNVVITIDAAPVVAAAQTKTICSGQAVNYHVNLAPATLPTGTTYSWPAPTMSAGSPQGTPGSGVAESAGNTITDILTNTTGSPITATYVITPTSAATCPGVPVNVVITINPAPVIAAGQTKTICSGQAVNYHVNLLPAGFPAGTTYSWSAPTMSAGGAQGTAGASIPESNPNTITDILTNTSGLPITATYTLTPTSGGLCAGAPVSVVITVNPAPVVTLAQTKTICSGQAVNYHVTLTPGGLPSGTTYTWSAPTMSAGAAQGTGGTTVPESNALTITDVLTNIVVGSQITATYKITPTSGAGCAGVQTDVVIRIDAAPVVAAAQTKTICSGQAVNYHVNLAPATLPTGTTYSWPAPTMSAGSPQGTPGSGVAESAGNTITDILTNTTGSPITATYVITPTSAATCPGVPVNVVITINPAPVIAAGQTKTICSGQAVNYHVNLLPAGFPAGTTYSWSAPTMSAGGAQGTAGASVPESNPNTITDILTNTSGLPITATYTLTPTSGGLCAGAPVSVVITVNPAPVVTLAQTKTICSGQAVNYHVTLTPGGLPSGTTYTWLAPTMSAGAAQGTGGTTVPESNALTITDVLTNIVVGSQITATYKITPTSGAGCAGVQTDVVIRIDAAPVVAAAQTKTICSGQAVNYHVNLAPATLPTGTTYSWPAPTMSAGSPQGTPGSGVAESAGNTITDILTNTTGSPITATYVITPTSAATCPGVPVNVVITINPAPVIAAGQTKTICSGQAVNYHVNLLPAGFPAGTTYSWSAPTMSAGGAQGTAGASIPESNPNTITDILTNTSGLPITATYTLTPTSGGLCAGAPVSVVITVNPAPVVTLAQTKTICSGQAVNYHVTLTPGGLPSGTTYTWSAPTMSAGAAQGTGGTTVPESNALTITDVLTNIVVGSQITATYKITPTSGAGCAGVQTDVVIRIDAAPVVAAAQTKTICSGQAVNYHVNLAPATLPTGTTYSWPAPTMSAGSPQGTPGSGVAESAGNTITDILTNTTGSPITATYVITPTSAATCPGVPVNVVITINPAPVIAAGQTKTICSGQAVNYHVNLLPAGFPAGTTYSWSAPTMSAGGAQGTAGASVPESNPNTITDILTNTSGLPITATYTLTPTSGGLCAGAPVSVVITVNPAPVITASQIKTICSNSNVNYRVTLTPGGFPAGTLFSWPLPTMSAGSAQGTTGSLVPESNVLTITDLLLNTTSLPITATYNITPTSAAGCAGTMVPIVITVNPEPVGTTSVATICSDLTVGYDLQANVNLNNALPSNFSWIALSNTNIIGESLLAHTGSVIDDILVNTTNVPQVVTYNIIPASQSTGCMGNQFTINVTVNPRAKISAGPDLNLCQNVPSIALQGTVNYAPNGVLWTGGAGIYSNNASPTSNYTYSNPSEINQTLTLTLTALDPDGAGPCISVADQMTLKINPLPLVAFFGLPPSIAVNSPPILLSGTQSGGLFTISPLTSNIGSTVQAPTDQASFDPSAVTLGVNTVTYTFTDGNGCTNMDAHNVLVNPVTDIDFALQYICGVPLPLQCPFVPKNALGEFEICADQGQLKIVGNPDPSSGQARTDFTGIGPNGAVIQAKITQSGTTWLLDTDGLPSGLYEIQYYYTNSNGDPSNPLVYYVRVFASPIASIIPPPNNCIVSAIVLNNNSTMSAPNPFGGVISNWFWNFGDGTFGAGPTTSHSYGAPAVYNVTLDVTTNNGCTDKATLSLRVGPQPIVNFNWSAICTNDLTKFVDQSNPGISTIIQYTWDFGDGNTIVGVPAGPAPDGGTFQNPWHNYVATGTYPAKLTVDTNDGCTNSLSRNVFILTGGLTVQPNATAPYSTDFETVNGWIPEGLLLPAPAPPGTTSPSSWIFGLPDGANINSAASGTKAWWTGANVHISPDFTYYDLESSAVNGPCFDLTLLKRPMITLDYWVDAEKNLDGAVVQYSTNGGINWSIVGPLPGLTGSQRDQGINWYDPNATIVSNPGQQLIGQYGWTDKSLGWKNARFNLDMVPPAARGQVRVRIAFSSNDKNAAGNTYEGFAFDNVYVGEKQRNVLVEHFTNSSLVASVTGDSWVNQRYQDQLINRGTSDFYNIQYHIGIPSTDPLNVDNPTDPAGRSLYFGVSQPPFTIIDGVLDGVKFKGNYTDLDANGVEADRRALKNPQVDLVLTATSTGTDNKISVTLDITARQNINTPLIAHVALLENQVGTFKNVLRKQLFGTDGETITLPFTGPPSATTVTRTRTNVVVNVPITNPSNLTLVAFVQDKNTKEIYQSIVKPAPVVQSGPITGIDETIAPTTLNGITVYPNPVRGTLNFALPEDKTAEGFAWKLIDQRGVIIKSGNFDDLVNYTKQVDVSGLSNGVYLVMLSGPGQSIVYRKLVVMN